VDHDDVRLDSVRLDDYFKDWLLLHMITQEEAARCMGTRQPQISRVCNGKKLSISFVKRLAKYMEMDDQVVAKMAVNAKML